MLSLLLNILGSVLFLLSSANAVAEPVTDREVPVDYPRNPSLERAILSALETSPLTVEQKAQHVLSRLGYDTGVDLNIRELVRLTRDNIDRGKSHRAILRYIMHSLNSSSTDGAVEQFLPQHFPMANFSYEQLSRDARSFSRRWFELDEQIKIEKDPQRRANLGEQMRVLGEEITQYRLSLMAALRARLLVQGVTSKFAFANKLSYLWFNRLNVNIDNAMYDITDYYQVIGSLTRGKFEEMVLASARHPAMLNYLNNAMSRGRNASGPLVPNEDYARELIELHTWGLPAGDTTYSLADVRVAAKILTGWSIDGNGRDDSGLRRFRFYSNVHSLGAKTVFGGTFQEGESGGIDLIRFLARHARTGRSVSKMLVEYFVTDRLWEPEAKSLVENLAQTYNDSQGDLSALYSGLVSHPIFWSANSFRSKAKDPLNQVVTMLRMSGHNLRTLNTSVVEEAIKATSAMGQDLFRCVPPTGYGLSSRHWASTNNVLLSIRNAFSLASFASAPGSPLTQLYGELEGSAREAARANREQETRAAIGSGVRRVYGLNRAEGRFRLVGTHQGDLVTLGAIKPDEISRDKYYLRTSSGLLMGSINLSVH